MRLRQRAGGIFPSKPRRSACIPIRPRRLPLPPNLTGFFARLRPKRDNCSPYSALVMPNLLDSCLQMTRNSLIRAVAALGTGLGTVLVTVLGALSLSGCASDEMASRILVEPDRYVLYACPELATAWQANMNRQHEL